MTTNKKLSLALLLAISTMGKASDEDNGMTFGEGVTAPGAFALDLGADAVTFGRAHQTKNYVERNRNHGEEASSDNLTAGEAIMTPASGTLNIFSGQTRRQGRRNFHSSDEQQQDRKKHHSKRSSQKSNRMNNKDMSSNDESGQ